MTPTQCSPLPPARLAKQRRVGCSACLQPQKAVARATGMYQPSYLPPPHRSSSSLWAWPWPLWCSPPPASTPPWSAPPASPLVSGNGSAWRACPHVERRSVPPHRDHVPGRGLLTRCSSPPCTSPPLLTDPPTPTPPPRVRSLQLRLRRCGRPDPLCRHLHHRRPGPCLEGEPRTGLHGTVVLPWLPIWAGCTELEAEATHQRQGAPPRAWLAVALPHYFPPAPTSRPPAGLCPLVLDAGPGRRLAAGLLPHEALFPPPQQALRRPHRVRRRRAAARASARVLMLLRALAARAGCGAAMIPPPAPPSDAPLPFHSPRPHTFSGICAPKLKVAFSPRNPPCKPSL